MTQEYTPTTDDAIDLIVAGMGAVTQLGIAPVGYPRTETDAVEAAKRWLAAHDAQIRADAWEFTNEERDLMLKSALDFTETDDAQEVDEMIADIIGSVVEHRKEQQ